MSDRPINRETDAVRDNDGNVYDIEGDRAKQAPGDPRDATTGYPTSGFVAGGAGGTGSFGAASASGTSSAAPGSTSDLRATSDSGVHGGVAEAADLGQRPLEDYKREGDAAVDATDTTVRAGTGSSDPADSRMVGNYTSDTDAVGTTGTGSTQPARGASTGTTSDLGMNSGTIAANTDNTSDRMSSDPASAGTTRGDVGSGGGGISVTNDNTAPLGSAVSATLTNVAEGYRVVDANGDEIGKVREVRSGDAGAATTGGADDGYDEGADQSTQSTVGVAAIPTGVGAGTGGTATGAGIPAVIASDQVDDQAGVYGDDEPNVDEPAYTRLRRMGFIKVDSKGWFTSDRYAGADQVDRVEGETVHLSATKDELISER